MSIFGMEAFRRPYAIKVLGLLVVILGADCIASTRLGLGPAIVG
jgi:hypothetical protein